MRTIAIKPLAQNDADGLFATVRASLPTLSQWLPWATPDYDLAQAEAWIAHCIRSREAGDEFHFGIFDDSTGDLLGGVGLNHRDRADRSARMGYWVADAACGRGIAAEAARQAAHFGFDTLGLRRIDILIHPENTASLRVAEKLGAKRSGILHDAIVRGSRTDDGLIFSLAADARLERIDK